MMSTTMKALVFAARNRVELREKAIPEIGPNDALMKVTLTTICGTDVHIVKGEYPVSPGLTIGHEPVGVIERLGANVDGYHLGQRVIAGAITPSATSYACLDGRCAQDGGCTGHGYKALGGWRLGNTIDGCQADYVRIPDAMANLAPIPDDLTDEDVLMCPDILSTGLAGAESADIRPGDAVAVFAQGPIGLCATAGARLKGASLVIGVEGLAERREAARAMGADLVIDPAKDDPVERIRALTNGRGVDAAIEALGTQQTFEACLRVLKPGGTLSSLGVYAQDLRVPLDAFHAGIGDIRIVTTLCPGGKERMRRLMTLVAGKRLEPRRLITHRFGLDRIVDAYDLFAGRRDQVLKVAITP